MKEDSQFTLNTVWTNKIKHEERNLNFESIDNQHFSDFNEKLNRNVNTDTAK